MLQVVFGYWKMIVFGLIFTVFTGLMLYNGHLKSVIKDREADIATLTTEIQTQNAAVEKLGAESAAKAASAVSAQASAAVVRERVVTKVERIYVTPPGTPGDSCKSALQLLNETVE